MSTQEIYRNYQFCYVQNQTENYPKKWDRSETVVEIFQNDSYGIKVDGTSCITSRNRRFLRKFTLASSVISNTKRSAEYHQTLVKRKSSVRKLPL